MPKYKVTASKSQKKYTFVFDAENEILAKKRIHDDGYSILGIEIFVEENFYKNIFIYEVLKNWEKKTWRVIWNDIFKIYLKLKDWIWYDILKLYSIWEKNRDEKYKNNLIKNLEEQYKYFKNTKQWKIWDSFLEDNKKQEKNVINIDNFYLKKQLEETYKLVDFVLDKLNYILNNDKYNLDFSKKEKLKKLYNSLVKIKSSTNISKLKEVSEAVLLKVWEIELKTLEKHKDESSKKYLLETNKLLKKIWSEKKFIEESKNFNKKIKDFFTNLETFFKSNRKLNKENIKKGLDKSNYEYLKNIIFLNKYKQKLKENTSKIIKNFWIYILPIKIFEEEKHDILTRRKVIKQNIYLFKAKLNWKSFSYTKTVRWFNSILDSVFNFFNYIKDYLFFVVLFYSFLFLVFLNIFNYSLIPILDWSLNYNWIFYFLIFLLIYFAIYFSRWLYSLIFNFIILLFIIFFSLINF